MKIKYFILTLLFGTLSLGTLAASVEHPSLTLTRDGVKAIRKRADKAPLFDASLERVMAEAQTALGRPLEMPVPKDGGGGYTHEAHKRNYYDMYYCGLAYQVSGDKKYARKVEEMLLAYAQLYPTLDWHPLTNSPVRGRLFWQTLNESVWLVHLSMAYDCVYDAIKPARRKVIENGVFRPACSFIMEGTPENRANEDTFNKMHNHGTWAQAAVGMAAIVMGDDALLDKALYGSRPGGGFLRQMDSLFSPEGYFTEGAYYLRYAIWPFMLFAESLQHNRPELKVFEYRDGILFKAMDVLVQLAYHGEFFHFNDALQKGYWAQELICATDVVYANCPSKDYLLSIVRDYQKQVNVSDAGFRTALDLAAGQAKDPVFRSGLYTDGPKGRDGAFAVLRCGDDDALTFKATSHGLSHGHYDKLTFAWYDSGNEVISDYGASRFLNIEAKNKGHYTRENKSYAMTTVAHNTLVVDETSHFQGKISISERYSPVLLAYSDDDRAFQYVAALDTAATPGVRMQRWMGLARIPFLSGPLIIDLLKAESAGSHSYDYPIHYNGHMVSLSVPYQRAMETMRTMGSAPGYKHLWVEAEAKGGKDCTSYTWICGTKLYSITTATTMDSQIYLLRSGANDPDFNLRSEPSFLLRETGRGNHLFASCIETHGHYDLQVELASDMERSCTGVTVLSDDASGMKVRYDFKGGNSVTATVDYATNTMKINY